MAGEFERHLARQQHRIQNLEQQVATSRMWLRVLVLTQLIWLVAIGYLAMNLFNISISIDAGSKPAAVPVAAPAPVIVPPTPVAVAPEPAEPEKAEEVPEAVPEPDPTGVRGLVTQAWDASSSGNLSRAEQLFKRAIALSPSDGHANYGYAYVLLEQGRTTSAQGPLCTALYAAGSDVELGREVESLRSRHNLTCR